MPKTPYFIKRDVEPRTRNFQSRRQLLRPGASREARGIFTRGVVVRDGQVALGQRRKSHADEKSPGIDGAITLGKCRCYETGRSFRFSSSSAIVASNTRPPARWPKTRTSRKLPPDTTNCDYARLPPNARHSRAGRDGEEVFHRIQDELDWPSSMPRQPAAFNRWRVEANCWRWAGGRSNPGLLPEESPEKKPNSVH